jgi:hypothetical protein
MSAKEVEDQFQSRVGDVILCVRTIALISRTEFSFMKSKLAVRHNLN